MKKILASLAAAVAVTGFASGAYAGSGGVQTVTTGTSYNSEHSGTVNATCTINVTDGAFTNAGLVSSLTSTTLGKISTVCNNSASSLAVILDTGVQPSQLTNAVATAIGFAETFQLTNGNGAYPTTPMSAFGTTYNKIDLSNGFSTTASNMDVTAKVAVNSGYNLPSGTYTVKVKATVTP
jgi:hypothetical protein